MLNHHKTNNHINKKYLGATTGIIQILHTWGQELNYHPHINCIVSGGGLPQTMDLKLCTNQFLVRVEPLVKNSVVSFCSIFINTIQKINCIFLNHAKSCTTIIHGTNSRTNFIPQTGIPKSKKLSTVTEMPLNILDAIPIALLSRIQELFLLTRKKFLFMLKIIEPTSKRLLLFPMWNLSVDS